MTESSIRGRRTFGPASEEPYRRRTSDWLRVTVAVAVAVVLARRVGDTTATEDSIFQFFASLPSALDPVLRAVQGIGALWAVGLVAAAALLARRLHLSRDLLVAGVLGWAVARTVGEIVVEDKSLISSLRSLTHSGAIPNFPTVRLTVLVAVVATAAPYVTRAMRYFGNGVVGASAIATMRLGLGYPNSVFAAIVIGWGTAAIVHLVFGSPGGRPTIVQIEAALDELGFDAHDTALASEQRPGSALFTSTDSKGALLVKVIGRDQVDARLFSTVWRSIAYRDAGPHRSLTRLHQVQSEALMTLLAEAGGVRVPRVLAVGTAGPGAALLVERRLSGPRLCDVEPSEVTDDMLDAIWEEVGKLRAAQVAHGGLNTRHVIVEPEGPAIVDFATAAVQPRGSRIAIDVAELMASTSTIVGAERAASAALRALGAGPLAEALPFLEPAALTRATRNELEADHGDRDKRLVELRETGARLASTEVPKVRELWRVSRTNLFMAVGTLIAIAALLSQLGDPSKVWVVTRHADWGLVGLGFMASMATNVPFAVALMGAAPFRLPFGATTELQVAMSFPNLVVPAIGGTAMQIRYLQKHGAGLAEAIAAGGLLSQAANVVVQIGLLGFALALTPDPIDLGQIPTDGIAAAAVGIVLVLGVAGALVLGVPRLRAAIVPPVRQAAATIWTVVRSPRRLALLVVGNVAATALSSACLSISLAAFGASLSYWTVMALGITLGTLAALVPVPGGGSAVASAGLAGACTAFGVPAAAAVAAVIVNQLLYNYLPAIPGWFATRHMVRAGYL